MENTTHDASRNGEVVGDTASIKETMSVPARLASTSWTSTVMPATGSVESGKMPLSSVCVSFYHAHHTQSHWQMDIYSSSYNLI